MPLQKGPGVEQSALLVKPPPAPWLYDPYNWMHASRGRDFQFFATDEDIIELLTDALLPEFGPYALLVPYPEVHGKGYREAVRRQAVSDFTGLRAEGFELFQVESHAITGEVDFTGTQKLSVLLGVNGLLRLHHGNCSKKLGWLPSRLSLVHRIVQQFTGERYKHREYDRIFGCLKRAIRKRLKYRTLPVHEDGATNDYPIMMTKRFKQAVERGEIATIFKPGDPL